MRPEPRGATTGSLAVLHPVFALSGVLHAIGGPLSPSLVARFHLADSQTGLLFFLYFAGNAVGAIACRGDYARAIRLGCALAALSCLLVAAAGWPSLAAVFAVLGVGVGMMMSAVSLFVGRAFPERSAAILTQLNFTWSMGALAGPLLATRILLDHDYRTGYLLMAVPAALAALVSGLLLRDAEELPRPTRAAGGPARLGLIAVFALAAFLQVGVENTAAAWLSTYALRMTASGVAVAAAATSLYWSGFLASRGAASILLLGARPVAVLRIALIIALLSGVLLAAAPAPALERAAMLAMGASLAPVFPLVIAGSLARARHTSDSRWILASAGSGGSVLPWLAGWLSSRTGSLRAGIAVIPMALAVMIFVLPGLSRGRSPAAEGSGT